MKAFMRKRGEKMVWKSMGESHVVVTNAGKAVASKQASDSKK